MPLPLPVLRVLRPQFVAPRLAACLQLACLALAVVARPSSAQCPSPSWIATFGGQQGFDAAVRTATEHSDGATTWTVVGGEFTRAAALDCLRIARWNGSAWSPMAGGFNNAVHTVARIQVGATTSLYAAGSFTSSAGTSLNRIARWTGSSWAALGTGLNGTVNRIIGHDDGSGPALYAVGSFSVAGGVSAANIARWNGTSWSALGSGLNSTGAALASFNDGSGPALFAGGSFTTAGGVTVSKVAKWRGGAWSNPGGGISGGSGVPSVSSMAVHNDGTGAKLVVAGEFTFAGSTAANRIAQWNGSAWTTFGNGLGPPNGSTSAVLAVASVAGASGSTLYAGGYFTSSGSDTVNRIARWTGSAWQQLGSGLNEVAHATVAIGPAGAQSLVVAGNFTSAGNRVVRWSGNAWLTYGDGPGGPVNHVVSVPSGPAAGVYATGLFVGAGGTNIQHAARWNGTSFAPIGSGLAGPLDRIDVLTLGGETALYTAAPHFGPTQIGTPTYVAKWTGQSWSVIPPYVNGTISAMTTFFDGTSTKLVVGTNGIAGPPTNANRVIRWNGSYWDGFGTQFPGSSIPWALGTYADPLGETLYVGGSWGAGGFSFRGLYRWRSDIGWQLVSDGPHSAVFALKTWNDGSGNALYAAGSFTAVGALAANRIARWNGSSWSSVGAGFDGTVQALHIHDDGSGAALYACGSFTASGGTALAGVARWNGSAWVAVGSGFASGSMMRMASTTTENGPALLVAGSFSASPSGDSFMARWGCGPRPPCEADVNGDERVDAADMAAVLTEWGPCDLPGCAEDIDGDGAVNAKDLAALVASWGECPF